MGRDVTNCRRSEKAHTAICVFSLADIQCRALGLGLLCAVESRGETNTIKEMLTLKPEEQASHRTVGALGFGLNWPE